MSGLISQYWKKIPVNYQHHIQVALTTLLIYCAMLVMFRKAPPQQQDSSTATGVIQQLDINSKENKDLAEWINTHDPSALINPDHHNGYSWLLNTVRVHTSPEDLPAPPPLSLPQMPEMERLPQRRPARNSMMPPVGEWKNSSIKLTQAPANSGISVWLNGSRADKLEKMLKEMLAERKVQPASRKLQTVLQIGQKRLNGAHQDIYSIQSSGIKELDDLATHAIYYLQLNDPDALKSSDTVTIIWHIELSDVPSQGGSKK